MAAAGSRKRRAITYDVTSKKKRKVEDKKEEDEELCALLKSVANLPALCKEKILYFWVMNNLQKVDTYDDVSKPILYY